MGFCWLNAMFLFAVMEVASGEYGDDKVKIMIQSLKNGNCDKMVSILSRDSTPRHSNQSFPSISENEEAFAEGGENTELLLRENTERNGHANGYIVSEADDKVCASYV